MRLNRARIIIKSLIVFFFIIDLFPIFDKPYFRYNGSNQENLVWNLGYPFVLLIYDPSNSPYIFKSPIFWLAISIQLLLVFIVNKIIKNINS